MDPDTLKDQSKEKAREAFDICVQSLQRTMDRLKIPMARNVKVSGIFVYLYYLSGLDRSEVRPGYQEDISDLVEVTRDIVKERLKGDAWVVWAVAQRASLPVKIDACITYVASTFFEVMTAIHVNFPLESKGMGCMYLR
jgi:hypothetical protein